MRHLLYMSTAPILHKHTHTQIDKHLKSLSWKTTISIPLHTHSVLKKASLKGLRQHWLLGHPKRLSSPSAIGTERTGDGRESTTTFPKRKQTKEEEKTHGWLHSSCCMVFWPLTGSELPWCSGRCWPDRLPMPSDAPLGRRVAACSSFHLLHRSSQTAAPVGKAAFVRSSQLHLKDFLSNAAIN